MGKWLAMRPRSADGGDFRVESWEFCIAWQARTRPPLRPNPASYAWQSSPNSTKCRTMTKWASALTAEQFVTKWSKAQLSERAASQEHFIDLCHLLGQPTPAEADATGADYCFEKHVKVVGSASKGSKGDYGFVHVWKRG